MRSHLGAAGNYHADLWRQHKVRIADDIDIICAASVRGHLRFGWRALYAPQYQGTKQLYKARACDEGARRRVMAVASQLDSHVNADVKGELIEQCNNKQES